MASMAASTHAAVLVSYNFAGATDEQAVALTADRTTATSADNPGGTLASIATEFTSATGFAAVYDNESDAGGLDGTGSLNFQMKGSSGTQTPTVAVTNNSYFEFTVDFAALGAGLSANLTSLDFIAAKSGNGNRGFFVVTNGTADGFGYDAPSDEAYSDVTAASIVNFDSVVDSTRDTDAGTTEFTPYSISLTGSDFQNLTQAVTFRLYATSNSSSATVQFDDFTLNGSVIPEPSTLGLALLGAFGLLTVRSRRQ